MTSETKIYRSSQQNNAMHLGFEHLADELNDAGLDMRIVIKPEVEIPWNKESVKDNLFKPIAKAMYGVDSTRDLTKDQVSKVWDVMMRHLGEKFGVFVAFPSQESLDEEKNVYDSKHCIDKNQ